MYTKCSHCNEEIQTPVPHPQKNHVFCCQGCLLAHDLISNSGLNYYYDLKRDIATGQGRETHKFKYLNQPEFQEKLSKNEFNQIVLSLHVKGIHCQACMWVLERLPSINNEVLSSQLNWSKHLLKVTLKKSAKDLSSVLENIEQLGYPCDLIFNETDLKQKQEEELKDLLIKTTIAFVAMGNIMLMALSIYMGLEGILQRYFHWLSFILSLPVVLFSAIPFYKTSFSALRKKLFSLDLPIAFAIIVGELLSLYFLIIGDDHIYFDTITTLTFLLLGSRYLLMKVKIKSQNENYNYFYGSNQVLRNGEYIHPTQIQEGDHIKIDVGQYIPTDGKLITSNALIDNSLMTGESQAVQYFENDQLLAGQINLQNEIEYKATKSIHESATTLMIEKLKSNWGEKTPFLNLADQYAKRLIFIIISVTFFILIFNLYNNKPLDESIKQFLAIIIITCPCGLGLIVPLTMLTGLNRMSAKGVLVRDDSAIEKINSIQHVFFDKTGTLTDPSIRFEMTFPRSFELDVEHIQKHLDEETKHSLKILWQLQKNVFHPIAFAFKSAFYFLEDEFFEISDFEYIKNQGPRGTYKNSLYEVLPHKTHSGFCLYKDSKRILEIKTHQKIKKHARQVIDFLKSKNKEISLLSGDHIDEVKRVAQELGIGENQTYGQKSPEQKAQIVKDFPATSMLVGDGVNDTIAMKEASISIAMNSHIKTATSVSSLYFATPSLELLTFFFKESHKTLFILKTNIALSFLYNIIGVSLSIMGHISPLMAAIIMPLNALLLFLWTRLAFTLK